MDSNQEIDQVLDELAEAQEGIFDGEAFYSSDGKMTVHFKANTPRGRADGRMWAELLYDQVLEKYGTKAAMWGEAMGKKPVVEEKPKVQEGPNPPICGIHNQPMNWKTGVSKTSGKPYAFWSCSEKMGDGGWCTYKAPRV
jgi:hypothetical protein